MPAPKPDAVKAEAKAHTITPAAFEPVRVSDATLKVHRTVRRFVAEADADRYTILADHPALDRDGSALPVKPITNGKD